MHTHNIISRYHSKHWFMYSWLEIFIVVIALSTKKYQSPYPQNCTANFTHKTVNSVTLKQYLLQSLIPTIFKCCIALLVHTNSSIIVLLHQLNQHFSP